MLVCQMTTKPQIELRKGIYFLPRLKIQVKDIVKNVILNNTTRVLLLDFV